MATDREKNEFKGPVHRVRTEIELSPSRSYRVNPGSLELLEIFTSEYDGQRNLYELFTFDENGRLLEEASFENLTDQESFRFVYTYDDAGRIIKRDEYDQSGSADGKTIYTYDSEGGKVEEVYYSARGYGARYTKFDQRGIAVEMICYGPDGGITSKNIWESSYDISGNRVEEITTCKTGPPQPTLGINTYAYLGWSEEKPVEQFPYSQEPQKHRRVTISDDAGNIVEEVDYDTDGSVFEGRLIECLTIFTDKRPVIKKAYSGHDLYGNWLKEVWLSQYEEGAKLTFVPFMTVHRKIIYY